jgi:phosphopantothenoylcysteine synthetase/decarboxylase
LVAPAANTQMWSNKITQQNVYSLMNLGVKFVSPIEKKISLRGKLVLERWQKLKILFMQQNY